MTKIILHGYLKDLHPHEIEVEASSAAEAISSLSLIPALAISPGKHHMVQVDGFGSRDALYDRRELDVLHIRPVIGGAGRGVGQIIIGIVLIVVGYFTAQPNLIMSGAMMVLGGVLQMLAPQPSLSNGNEERSRYLGSGKNTVAIGTRIPMIYGRRKAYGHYLSFDIDAGKFDSAPADWYSSPFTNYGELTNSAAPVDLPLSTPDEQYHQPSSFFTTLSHPASITEEYKTFINFSPALVLLSGVYDISFATGQTLHVENPTAGTVSRVTLLGGETDNLPPSGTSIVFSQNYE